MQRRCFFRNQIRLCLKLSLFMYYYLIIPALLCCFLFAILLSFYLISPSNSFAFPGYRTLELFYCLNVNFLQLMCIHLHCQYCEYCWLRWNTLSFQSLLLCWSYFDCLCRICSLKEVRTSSCAIQEGLNHLDFSLK